MKSVPDVFESTGEIEKCRKCGGITEITKVFPTYEIHLCRNGECGTENEAYTYRVMIEQEQFEEEDEEEFDNTPSKKSREFWG